MMLPYTICFIKRGNEILLLNRNKSPLMGMWNGVGGKVEKEETHEQCIIREVEEETDITLSHVDYKGTITWNVDDSPLSGMYAYLANVPETFSYDTPIQIREGVLEWKDISWILHQENKGVVSNIKYFLPYMLRDNKLYTYHLVYKQDQIKQFTANEKDYMHKANY